MPKVATKEQPPLPYAPHALAFRNDHRGVSLLIAIMFVAAFILVMAGLMAAQSATFKNLRLGNDAARSRDLSEAAIEVATAWVKRSGLGSSTSDLNAQQKAQLMAPLFEMASDLGVRNCADMDGDANTADPCIDITILGRSSVQLGLAGAQPSLFSVPSAGKGTAAQKCGVNPLDADEACNWNTLKVGETIEIPLYYVTPGANDGPDEVHKIPFPNGQGTFSVRVRTPCVAGAANAPNCAPADRVELYPTLQDANAYRVPEKDKVLVQWLITSEDGKKVLLARDAKELNLRHRDAQENTEISAGRVNAFKDDVVRLYEMLAKNYRGKQIGLLRPPTIQDYIIDPTILRPVLRLSLVGQPYKSQIAVDGLNDDGIRRLKDAPNHPYDVPFLEYQLLTSSPVADAYAHVTVSAQAGSVRKEMSTSIAFPPTLGGFALENL